MKSGATFMSNCPKKVVSSMVESNKNRHLTYIYMSAQFSVLAIISDKVAGLN